MITLRELCEGKTLPFRVVSSWDSEFEVECVGKTVAMLTNVETGLEELYSLNMTEFRLPEPPRTRMLAWFYRGDWRHNVVLIAEGMRPGDDWVRAPWLDEPEKT